MALGSGRWAAARLVLIENIVLSTIASILGVALAAWGIGILNAVPPLHVRGIPVVFRTDFDATAAVFGLAAGAACGVLFGAAPALQIARLDTVSGLRASHDPSRRSPLRNALVGVETALACAVLIAAALFLRSFMETRDAETGFRRAGVLLASYDLTGRGADDRRARTFAASLLDALRELPAVDAAAIATAVPLDLHGLPSRTFTVEGRPRPDGQPDEALANTITPGYFDVLDIPFVAGRDFTALLDESAPREAIVNETFVRRYLDGEPVGRRIRLRDQPYVIVGVVRDTLYEAFGESRKPIVYTSFRDRPAGGGEIHVHTLPGSERTVAASLRAAVRRLDPSLPVFDIRTMDEHIEANLVFRRIPARLFVVIGPLLLLLAATGVYATAGYAVSLRTREIGVRLALGATPRRVVAGFVAESLTVVIAGGACGWLLAFAARMVTVADGGVDPVVFAGVPALLVGVAALASWRPASRAARVDPVAALRRD